MLCKGREDGGQGLDGVRQNTAQDACYFRDGRADGLEYGPEGIHNGIDGGQQRAAYGFHEVAKHHLQLGHRVGCRFRDATDLAFNLAKDDLLRRQNVVVGHCGLNLFLLRVGERDTSAAQGGHSLDGIVQGLAQHH